MKIPNRVAILRLSISIKDDDNERKKKSFWVTVLWLLVILSLATFCGIRDIHEGRGGGVLIFFLHISAHN